MRGGEREVLMELLVLSRSHVNTPLDVRERLNFPRDEIAGVLRSLRETEGLPECVLLCTCNRVELYLSSSTSGASPDVHVDRALGALGDLRGAPAWRPEETLFLRGREAVRHLFRVAAGLESQVLGENEILGQVRTAYSIACEAETNGFLTNRVFHRAFRVGKRVRTGTGLCAGARSAGTLAVERAEAELGPLEGLSALVVGAGEVAAAVVRALAARKVARITAANRNRDRALGILRKTGADVSTSVVGLDDMTEAMAASDVVLSSTASPGVVITSDMIPPPHSRRGALLCEVGRYAARASRPLWICDLALPRDVERAVGELPGVTLRNLDDVTPEVERTEELRAREVPGAEAIVEREVESFDEWLRELAAVPSIQRLVTGAERIRDEVLEELRQALRAYSADATLRSSSLRSTRAAASAAKAGSSGEGGRLPSAERRGNAPEFELARKAARRITQRLLDKAIAEMKRAARLSMVSSPRTGERDRS